MRIDAFSSRLIEPKLLILVARDRNDGVIESGHIAKA